VFEGTRDGKDTEIQVGDLFKKTDFFDEQEDEKSEKADFGKMIEYKNSKHMIMVP